MSQGREDGVVEGGCGRRVGDLNSEVIQHAPSVTPATDVSRHDEIAQSMSASIHRTGSALWKPTGNPE